MKRWLAIWFFILPRLAIADSMSPLDWALEASYAATTAMDWAQTSSIVKSNHRYSEENPMLGKYPSQRSVNVYFPLMIASHAAISIMLPHPYRTVWQSVTLGVEVETVFHNKANGLSFSVPW